MVRETLWFICPWRGMRLHMDGRLRPDHQCVCGELYLSAWYWLQVYQCVFANASLSLSCNIVFELVLWNGFWIDFWIGFWIGFWNGFRIGFWNGFGGYIRASNSFTSCMLQHRHQWQRNLDHRYRILHGYMKHQEMLARRRDPYTIKFCWIHLLQLTSIHQRLSNFAFRLAMALNHISAYIFISIFHSGNIIWWEMTPSPET